LLQLPKPGAHLPISEGFIRRTFAPSALKKEARQRSVSGLGDNLQATLPAKVNLVGGVGPN
jgi:hypothetical protein